MIFPLPPNLGFSFVAMPVWQLAAAAHDPPPPQDPSPSQDCSTEAQPPPEPPAEPCWIFKGYEWRPLALWYPMVNPGWDHCVDNDPDDIRDRETRQEQER